VGRIPASPATSTTPTLDTRLIQTFASLIRARWADARIYLFGSHGRGTATSDSDYDIVVVTSSFVAQRPIERPVELYALWWEAGGQGISLDVHCYGPQEFRAQLGGLGYLGQARRRDGLKEIKVAATAINSPTGTLGTGQRNAKSKNPLITGEIDGG